MRFEFEGNTYEIAFRRYRQLLPVTNTLDSKVIETRLSTHPFTEVSLNFVRDFVPARDWKNYKKASVGCMLGDRFTKENGRLNALKKLSKIIPKSMRGPMWTAYMERTGVKAKTKPEIPPTVPAQVMARVGNSGDALVSPSMMVH